MKSRMSEPRLGFTLAELLTTMVMIGILSGIATPYLREAIYRAEARRIMTDVSAIRVAVFEYREDNDNALPPTAGWRTMPPGLAPYVNNVDFSYKNLEYRIRTNRRRGRVDFYVRYPRRDPVGAALRVFAQPGNDSGSMNWNNRRSRFRLLNNNQ